MNRSAAIPARRAFTLVECVCAITVIAVTSAVVIPIITGATNAYANASRTRDTSENVAFALDRCLSLLRESPVVRNTGALSITTASSTGIRFTDGRSLSFAGGVLTETNESGVSGVLLSNVTGFTIGYFAQDGAVSTANTPGSTWVFTVRIASSGFEMKGNAFARVRSLGS